MADDEVTPGIPATMELRYLAALVAVGRHGSFSRAAETLDYTQSAISQQIATLERIAGHTLVDRPQGARQASLTIAGKILVDHAEAITSRLAIASADMAALARGNTGVLRIGCFQSVGVRILPRLIGRFALDRPNVRVELVEAENDAELLRAVEDGSLDLTFMVFPMMDGPFDFVELIEDPYVVVVSSGSPLAQGAGPVALTELEGLPLVTYAQMREAHAIENRLGHPELTRQIVFRSNDNGTILGLAAEGIGAAIVSSLSVDPNREGVRTRSLAGVRPRVVGIAWHRDRYINPAAEAFVRVALEEAHAHEDSDLTAGGIG